MAHPDFIEAYADYADILEAPRAMHEAVATQTVAAVLNRNGVTVPHGGLTYPLDFWTVLLSGSGFGRSTLVGLADPVLEAAGLRELLASSHWGSAQAFYQQMAENGSHLFVWGELSEKLKMLSDARFGGVKQWLTNQYDNPKVPDPIKYRVSGRGQDTPSISFTSSPRTNILATSSEAWFFRYLEQEDSAGGFLPRWVMVRAGGPTKVVPTPKTPDLRLQARLAEQLKGITSIQGTADLSLVLPPYAEWYGKAKGRFEAQPNAALANAYFNRHRVHILKLAVVYEVSRSGSLKVSEQSWCRAVATARSLEETIFALLATGMTGSGYALCQTEDRIRAAGATGIPRSDLTRAYQHRDRREFQQQLATLQDADRVCVYMRKSVVGRPASVFVHRQFTAEYEQQNPGSQRMWVPA